MARTKNYNITTFNGGMTNNLRDTRDLSKCAYVAHFDIYRDPNQMHVMPGYIDDMSIGGDADGMKLRNVRAFGYFNNILFAVGTKANGTGSKLYSKANLDDAEWIDNFFSVSEGTDNLANFTYLGARGTDVASVYTLYWITVDGATSYITKFVSAGGGAVTDKHETISSGGAAATIPMVTEQFYTGATYATEGISADITFLDTNAVVNVKSSGLFVKDIQTGGEQLGIFGNTRDERKSRLLLWDSASLLVDQNIDFGKGTPVALGYISGFWVGVVNEGVGTDTNLVKVSNDLATFSVKIASGSSAETLYRAVGVTPTNGIMLPTRSQYRDTMLWYTRIATNSAATTFNEGVWACGKGTINEPMAVSVLLDTTSLGSVQVVKAVGNNVFIVHGGDASISRLDSFIDGVFDVPATYESLVFGAEVPFIKQLEGVSVVTENLPSGGSVSLYYRFDLDSAWTLMNTSNTAGTRKHNFTKAGGSPIGTFQEIQFKLEVTGKVQVKNILVTLNELDDLPFKA